MSITTSRWIRRSASNAEVSSVTLTLPSMSSRSARIPCRPCRRGGGEYAGDGLQRHQIHLGQVGLAEQSVLGERPLGSQVGETGGGGG